MTLHLIRHLLLGMRSGILALIALTVLQALLGALAWDSPWLNNLRQTVFIAQCATSTTLLLQGFARMPISATQTFWKTRPITRRQILSLQAVLLFGVLMLPLILSLLPGWWTAHFNSWQLFWIHIHWLLKLGSIGLLLAALINHGGTLQASFSFTVMATVLLLMAALAFNGLMFRSTLLAPSPVWSQESETGSRLVGECIWILFAGAAWMHKVLSRSKWPSLCLLLVGTLLLLAISVRRPFSIQGPTAPVPRPGMELVSLSGPQASLDGKQQVLWSQFKMNLPHTNCLALPLNLQAEFRNQSGFQIESSFQDQGLERSGLNIITQGILMNHLKERYPKDTLWSGLGIHPASEQIPIKTPIRSWPDDLTGTIEGSLAIELIDLHLAVDTALQSGHWRVGEGYQYKVEMKDSAPSFTVVETVPSLAHPGMNSRRHHLPQSIYVLLDPTSMEAWALSQPLSRNTERAWLNNQQQRTFEMPIPDTILESNLNPEDLRLHIYLPKPLLTTSLPFKQSNFTLFVPGPSFDQEHTEKPGDLTSLLTSWPGADDAEGAKAFVRHFLKAWKLPRNTNESRTSRNALIRLGPSIVPFFLEEAPFSETASRMVLQGTLPKLLQPNHEPKVRDLLAKYPDMSWLIRESSLETACWDALLPALKSRDHLLSADTIEVLARHVQSNDFDDLAWHAIHCPKDQQRYVNHLASLPGFPFQETVSKAWKLARLDLVGARPWREAAATEGFKDALYLFLLDLKEARSEAEEIRHMESVRALVTIPESLPPEDYKTWILRNASRLEYQDSSRNYTIRE